MALYFYVLIYESLFPSRTAHSEMIQKLKHRSACSCCNMLTSSVSWNFNTAVGFSANSELLGHARGTRSEGFPCALRSSLSTSARLFNVNCGIETERNRENI